MHEGQLEGFPKEVIDKMLERQVEQGNERNVNVFKIERYDGFYWEETIEGYTFWSSVIRNKDFDLFFAKYPKQKSKDFEEYINNQRSNFLKVINNQDLNTETRTAVESIIIAYDQMKEKLFFK